MNCKFNFVIFLTQNFRRGLILAKIARICETRENKLIFYINLEIHSFHLPIIMPDITKRKIPL